MTRSGAELLDRAHARGRAWALFARLYREGVTGPVADSLRDLPVLGGALPPTLDLEAAAAEHHTLFGLRVFPYGGAFLEPDGRVGGPSASVVAEVAAALGVAGDDGGEGDHLARTLELLAVAAELDGAPGRGADGPSGLLLDRHLLWWLPPFVLAVREEGKPFWTLVADLTLELAVDHRRSLGGAVAEGASPLPAAEPPALEDPRTDLHRIARFLVTPARSGLWLGGETLRRMGRLQGLPSGFGARERLLANLLGAAAEFDRVGEVLAELAARVGVAREHHRAVARDAPELSAVSGAWLERLDGTGVLLASMTAPGA